MTKTQKFLTGFILNCLLLPSWSLQATELNDFIGNWKGNINNATTNKTDQVEISLWLTPKKRLSGVAVYSDRACMTQVIQQKFNSDKLVLLEKGKCGKQSVTLNKIDDKLHFTRSSNKKNTNDSTTLSTANQSKQIQAFTDFFNYTGKLYSPDYIKKMQAMQMQTVQLAIAKQKLRMVKTKKQLTKANIKAEQQRQANAKYLKREKERQRQAKLQATQKQQLSHVAGNNSNKSTKQKEQQSVYDMYPDSPNTTLPSIMAAGKSTPKNSTPPAAIRALPKPKGRKLKNLKGFWLVSGESGSISKVTKQTNNNKYRYTMVYQQPKANKYSQAGFRKGDIRSIGIFDISNQILIDTPSMKASAANDAFANPQCSVIKASTSKYVLQDLGKVAAFPTAKAYTIKRVTPAHKICRYYLLTSGSCTIKRCSEMYTEKNIEQYKAKDDLLTNTYAYAKQYSQSIRYIGPSDAQLEKNLRKEKKDINRRDFKRLVKFGKNLDKAMKQSNIDRQRRQKERNRRKQMKRYKNTRTVMKALAVPDATTCQQYLEKNEYDDYDELALYGVKIGMAFSSAHQALMCNQFRIPLNILATIRSAKQYLSFGGGKRYFRKMSDGSIQFINLVLTPDQNQRGQRAYKIYSAKFSHELRPLSAETQWDAVRDKVLDKYDLSGRDKNDYSIIFKRNRQESLVITATRPLKDKRYAWTINLCCKR
ncbi:hypothetical protein MNBD_GAMMA22-1607 [hydrothermal vent metagenome]|uniref:Uncharacterized protein n=1 Tax=hydrothermal vent metagenome TaxID=652676 RepID=A0A3B0ZLV2_9ZZZZ